MNLARLLAAKRKEKEDLIVEPDAYETVFTEYERNVLDSVDSDKKSQKYSDMYVDFAGQRKPAGWGEKISYVKEGATGRELFEQQEMQRAADLSGPKRYTGPDRTYDTFSKDYVDNLIDESDRWKKTGSRYVFPETSADKRDAHMGRMYGGTTSTMTGVLGPSTTKKKKLLGK